MAEGSFRLAVKGFMSSMSSVFLVSLSENVMWKLEGLWFLLFLEIEMLSPCDICSLKSSHESLLLQYLCHKCLRMWQNLLQNKHTLTHKIIVFILSKLYVYLNKWNMYRLLVNQQPFWLLAVFYTSNELRHSSQLVAYIKDTCLGRQSINLTPNCLQCSRPKSSPRVSGTRLQAWQEYRDLQLGLAGIINWLWSGKIKIISPLMCYRWFFFPAWFK